MCSLLEGVGVRGELPNFIVFQDSNFSLKNENFSFFTHHFQEYSISSALIWLTNSETFVFCETCTSQLMPLTSNEVKNMEALHLQWKTIHKNLHLAKVTHSTGTKIPKTHCIQVGGRNDTSHHICLYVTLSQKYNYTFYFPSESLQFSQQEIIGSAYLLNDTKGQINNLVLL